MKPLFLILLTAIGSHAAPVISNIDWEPACDGANIEIVSDQSKLLSIRAFAGHSASLIEWTIHFIDGISVTAEFRETARDRISEGERAGEYSGITRLARLETFRWQDGHFQIADKILAEELRDILAKVKERRE
ncbi:MAG: hypothetical protein ABI162_19295 [Luteolibacter sp.]